MRTVDGRAALMGFISYAHGDKPLVDGFLEMLRPRLASVREIGLTVWSDKPSTAGSGWQEEIADAIATADFSLVCVTPSLLASRYVTAVELPALRASGSVLVAVALEPVDLDLGNVPGLRDAQIFHYMGSGVVRRRSFHECDPRERTRFCDVLVAEMAERLRDADERAPMHARPEEAPRPRRDVPPWRDGFAIDARSRDAGGLAPGLVEDLIQRMTPEVGVPSESSVRQARRNATARTALLREFGALTGDEIGEQHSRARNRHALAARWRKEGRVFGVTYHGRTVYPAFQFEPVSGELRQVVRAVLTALPVGRMSEWEVALWWTAANGWLGDRRPVDLLDDDPDGIVAAAAGLEPSPL
ncbi:MAG: toll/interleukin-1 receptor domain-containing protein [Solirubrobacteraceae bacterium]